MPLQPIAGDQLTTTTHSLNQDAASKPWAHWLAYVHSALQKIIKGESIKEGKRLTIMEYGTLLSISLVVSPFVGGAKRL
jgi:hypothetical protein